MYLGCPDPDAELLRRSRLYATLSEAEQARLLLLVLHTDQRGSANPRRDHALSTAATLPEPAVTQVVDAIERVASLPRGIVEDVAAHLSGGARRRPQRWPTTWARALATLAREAEGPWCLSAAFAACLATAGHVPCPAFAFGRWHLAPHSPADEAAIRRLVELACCYAYRLVGRREASRPGAVVGRGAYSVSTRHGAVVTKAATNLAASDFMLEQEARVLQCASRFQGRLPRFEGWDPLAGELRKEYIPGATGHDLLVRGEFPQRHYVDDLERAHRALADGLRGLGVRLDLHPGNFVWHRDRRRWALVDAGPIPAIGADYYDIESFDQYLQHVWLQRLDNMRRVPIRSLDWEPLLARG